MNITNLHLSYCSNIHAGETWDATFQNLKIYIPEVKKRLALKGAFGIGLRLSHEAALVLERPDRLQEFRDWLKKSNTYVFTLNCFPYGGFHRTKVKEQVHAPDWTTEDRLEYTIRSFRILAELLPEGVEGGISTSPLTYRHWFATDLEKKEALNWLLNMTCPFWVKSLWCKVLEKEEMKGCLQWLDKTRYQKMHSEFLWAMQ